MAGTARFTGTPTTATAAPGYTFTSWSGGGCSGSAASCTVTVGQSSGPAATVTVTAAFTAIAGDCTATTLGVDPVTNLGLGADCAALLAAKDALRGTAALNWDAATALTGWDGVTLGGSPQRVTGLDLRMRKLTGTIPAGLGSLTGLKTLYLHENQLTGAIPTELGNLTQLRQLHLNRNRLTGTIPAQLGSLANLHYLSLGHNQLTGAIPTELSSLANLHNLWLHQNQLSGALPTQLGSLTGLRELILDGNQLTGAIPTELGSLPRLRRVGLSNNALTGCLPRAWKDVATTDFAALGLDFCALPSTTLSYGAPSTTGSVTDDGDYAFLSDPDDLTTAVTTYEKLRTGLRDGATIGLVLHQNDGAGVSQADFYDLVEANDVVEWREADNCWMRYVIREVHPDPTGDPPRKRLTLQVYSHPYPDTGCTGTVRTTGSRTFNWTPGWFATGNLPAPVWHGDTIVAPESWSGTLPEETSTPPIVTTWPLDPVPNPDLGAGWSGSVAMGYGNTLAGYYGHSDGGFLDVVIFRLHVWPNAVIDGLSTDRSDASWIWEFRVINGWPAFVGYDRVRGLSSYASVGFYDAVNGISYGFHGGTVAQRNDPEPLIELAIQFLPDAP